MAPTINSVLLEEPTTTYGCVSQGWLATKGLLQLLFYIFVGCNFVLLLLLVYFSEVVFSSSGIGREHYSWGTLSHL